MNFHQSRQTRRISLLGAATFLIGLLCVQLLLACTSPAAAPSPTAATTSAAPTAAPKSAPAPTQAPTPAAQASGEPKRITFLGLGGFWEKTFREKIFPPFERQYGISVDYVPGSSGTDNQSKAAATAANPEYDVVLTNDVGLLKGKKAGLWLPLDKQRVTNLSRIYDIFLDRDNFGAAQGMAAIGIAYNTEIFQQKGFPKPESWNDLYRPEYKGHVMISSINLSYVQEWLPQLATLEGGSKEKMDAAFAKVKALTPNLLTTYRSASDFDDLFKQKEAWIGMQSQQRTNGLAALGFPAAFVFPKERAPYFTNYFVAVKGSKNPDAAMQFINYALSDEAQMILAVDGQFGPANREVKLPPEVASKVVYGPEQIAKLWPSDFDFITANLSEWTQRWNREIER